MRDLAALWWLGLLESLAVHRCVVLFVLDSSRSLGRTVLQCFLLNGGIFLGSTLLWEQLLLPAVSWLLHVLVAPCAGALAARLALQFLQLAFHALWLLPAYLVTLLVSNNWYTDVAKTAYAVKQRTGQVGLRSSLAAAARQASAAAGKTSGTPASGGESAGSRAGAAAASGAAVQGGGGSGRGAGGGGSGGGGGGGGNLEDVAQEVYRLVLFCVFFAEVWVLGHLPHVGVLLSCLFLSWLYAYYAYDYKWGLQAVRLPERLAYFERRWAFFAGFGLPMALCSLLLPFYQGAAVLAVLFPLYILVACDSDVNAVHERVVGKGGASKLISLPVFGLAVWPTQRIVRMVTGAGGPGPGAAAGGGYGVGGVGGAGIGRVW